MSKQCSHELSCNHCVSLQIIRAAHVGRHRVRNHSGRQHKFKYYKIPFVYRSVGVSLCWIHLQHSGHVSLGRGNSFLFILSFSITNQIANNDILIKWLKFELNQQRMQPIFTYMACVSCAIHHSLDGEICKLQCYVVKHSTARHYSKPVRHFDGLVQERRVFLTVGKTMSYHWFRKWHIKLLRESILT